MKVIFVGAGPGDPELLTVKAAQVIRNCRIIVYAGSLVSPEVLALLPAEAESHDSAGMSLDEILKVCEDARNKGLDVVRLHSGDPSLYGAIREQMNGLDKMGIAYEVVPGVSAFQAAAAALKTELTAPETAQAVILTRTAGRTPLPEEQDLDKLARSHATLCIYLSGHRIEETVAVLIPHYGRECPAAVVYHASWPDEKIVRSTLVRISGLGEPAGNVRELHKDVEVQSLAIESVRAGLQKTDTLVEQVVDALGSLQNLVLDAIASASQAPEPPRPAPTPSRAVLAHQQRRLARR